MAVVLVEGITDRLALEAVARRLALDLDGIEIVPIGGAQAIRRAAAQYEGERVAGLCDAGEERYFRRVLGGAAYVCDKDLEDELIRALGAAAVEQVVEGEGDLGSFRTLQKQPEWRERPVEEQLRRFMGSGGSRKIRYARLLVEALDLEGIPRPLDRVLAQVI
jgi:hypothetical protein